MLKKLESQLKTIVADHFCKCLGVVMQLTIDKTLGKIIHKSSVAIS